MLCKNRITELIGGGPDHLFRGNIDISIFIKRKFICLFGSNNILVRFCLGDRIYLFEDVVHDRRRSKNSADILEKEIAHESMIHDFLGMDMPRDGQHLFGIQLYHFAIVVFAYHREEVQEFQNMLLAFFAIACTTGCILVLVVRDSFNDSQRACRIKIEHIRIIFAICFAILIQEKARILGTECSLHIQRRRTHGAKHQNSSPFGNGDARRELPHRKGNSLFVVLDSFANSGNRLLVFQFLVAIAYSKDNRIFLEYRVLCQKLFQGNGRIYAIQQPERMLELVPEFFRRERILFLLRESVQELLYIFEMFKIPRSIRLKELVQVKVILRFFVINESSGIGLRTHHIGHLVGEKIELRQVFVRIFYTLFGKFPFAFLFVGVCPVEYSLFGELVASKHLERGARKVQRKTAFDAFQGNIRFIGFYALVRLVKNQHIPIKFRNFAEFFVIATKSLCAFKVLQGDKFNATEPVLAYSTSKLIPC